MNCSKHNQDNGFALESLANILFLNKATAKTSLVFIDILSQSELDITTRILKELYRFDKSLFYHSWQTAIYSSIIGIRLNVDPDVLFIGGLLHDVGKIFIPRKILNKPDSLTNDEFAIIQQHPVLGSYYLQVCGIENMAVNNIVKFHHKRFDGKGYPDGDAQKEFCPFIHIVSASDAFDAMTSQRPYSKTKSVKESLLELKAHSGTQFSPEVVECFWTCELSPLTEALNLREILK